MTTPTSDFVSTDLGRWHVRRSGTGDPPVVLWHSLFVDSRSWGPVADAVAQTRTVYAVDGPAHGRSAGVGRRFTFAEVADGAAQLLDGLGCTAPVDWVGNAWGGHVGIQLAVRHPERTRTLITIGTPVHALTARERWTMVWPLVALYRVVGPNRMLLKALSEALIGAEYVAAQPDRSAEVLSAFSAADRAAMFGAMRSMMLDRPGMAGDVTRVRQPALLLAGRDDPMGWQPSDAEVVAATMPHARAGGVAGSGHVTPLVVDADAVLAAITDFWAGAGGPTGP